MVHAQTREGEEFLDGISTVVLAGGYGPLGREGGVGSGGGSVGGS